MSTEDLALVLLALYLFTRSSTPKGDVEIGDAAIGDKEINDAAAGGWEFKNK